MAESSNIVRVELGSRTYDIEIGQSTLSRLSDFAAQRVKVTHAVIVADARIAETYAAAVRKSLSASGARTDLLTVPSGEQSKGIEQATLLWDRLLECGADRRTVLVAVGGGVIGDLAGFIAATYTRGMPFLQVPTTLLAQVDSSVGGKVGVNLPRAKNMVGAFWQPAGVLIDTDTLTTLPVREYRSGLAEVVKYGVILDAEFFEYLEREKDAILQRHPDVLQRVITRCCELKAQVVAGDERDESGLRAVLNYGHTFGHAIEAECGYGTYSHGEAVAIGMMCAARLAAIMGLVPTEFTERQRNLLQALGLPIHAPEIAHERLIGAMSRDKKVEHGRLRFVLPTRLGRVELVGDVREDDVRATLRGP